MLVKGVNKMTVEVANIIVADKVFEPNFFETAQKVTIIGKHPPQFWMIFFPKQGLIPRPIWEIIWQIFYEYLCQKKNLPESFILSDPLPPFWKLSGIFFKKIPLKIHQKYTEMILMDRKCHPPFLWNLAGIISRKIL